METGPWEDSLLERKTESDLKDLLKTMVAFANSVKPGHTATILIGEFDDGSPVGVTNPDNIQKKVRQIAEKVYPAIVWRQEVYERGGKDCVRVEIEHSGETPHFGGPAWIRKGSESIKATEAIFQRLIDYRSGVVVELAKWLNKPVTVGVQKVARRPGPPWFDPSHAAVSGMPKLVEVNGHWATFLFKGERHSEPLSRLTLSYDNEHQRLKVLIDFHGP